MKQALTSLALLSVGLFASHALANGPDAKPAAGYSLALFDGQTLNGWHVTGSQAVVDDGAILLKSGDGFVRTDHRYGDFVLELDWKAERDKAWDSGIYIRCELPAGERPWPARYQINLLQGHEGDLLGLKGKNAKSTGLVKPGEWNHFKLTVIGDTAALEINGKPAWKTDGLEAPSGYIGFQSEVDGGGQFRFRNIQVTELTHQSLFNGKDLAGWEGAGGKAELCWQASDGTILCTGQKGPWLRSEKEYDDFNLRLRYKLKPGGNSGIYVRVPSGGNHHGKDAGVEIQVLDDDAEKYAKLKPYQYTGSVYAVAPATEHVGRPAGEWNALEINCQGDEYTITHNGVVIVHATPQDFPGLNERLKRGFLGLQNHSEEVWYQDLRIGPPLK